MPSRRWVVVSGASTGIGRAISLRLAREGWHVLAGYRRPEHAEQLKADAAALGAGQSLEPLRLEVTDERDIQACVARVEALRAQGDVLVGLVNNAGVFVLGGIETLDLAGWRRQFDINVFGVVALTRALLPSLIEAKGRVINISSIGGRVAQPLLGAYTASKFALEALSDALRMELADTGVAVSIIEPGAIKTPIFDKSMSQAEESIRAIPAYARARYEPKIRNLEKVGKRMMEKTAIDPDKVATRVVRALRARRPFTRALVGADARVLALLKAALPTRVMDWFIRKSYGV
ncbi:MAG: SDR family NAD(P)-dependent oxidoreductase [Tepidisphaera sp.]|nr:SDR family NAD(P)-dependent oxidoreductase [Tepidisphaera sp.]